MTCSERVSQWTETVSSHFPHLSRPQAGVLALWSLGMVLSRSCGLSQVSVLLALLLGQQEETLRQRLREWYYPAQEKRGTRRRTLEVETCFAPLLRWVLAWWPEEQQELALALDATTLGQRFTVLCISVLVRGCAIPVAWKVLAYNQKGSWQPYWQTLLAHLDGVIPTEWSVLVLADRGLYAPWLYRQIVGYGWHPFLRINSGGKCLPAGKRVYLDFDARSLKSQMRLADKLQAKSVIIIGEEELKSGTLLVRNMSTKEQRTIREEEL